ncbi:hypothetical protein B9Q02_11420 [Candidatus Marsarchaeota G1 archaeon BE_D]|jgi:hypothetical protein|uniref:Uncharacterized protein n=1 Tax=Candidatus Marsarchaeota G1 archaeon BE_D TaxID=1978156 RepID=A0A2R6A8D4_9ARCH|nr:MAG: hypothetical protein B9Q02_11420 [Candidatus Marsarchaeota G1 archaeon BE_D]
MNQLKFQRLLKVCESFSHYKTLLSSFSAEEFLDLVSLTEGFVIIINSKNFKSPALPSLFTTNFVRFNAFYNIASNALL